MRLNNKVINHWMAIFAIICFFSLPTVLSAGVIDLPRTGQDSSYGFGDDGAIQTGAEWLTSRFTVSGDCITDKLTGLMWLRRPSFESRSWEDALQYANSLNSLTRCGFKNWRLPNINEMESLINAGESSPFLWLTNKGFITGNIDTAKDGLISDYYWTSTYYGLSPELVWMLDLNDGGIYYESKEAYLYALPVRSIPVSTAFAPTVHIPQTGQNKCYDSSYEETPCVGTGQDGDVRAGIAWPSPRFISGTGLENACVTDNLTGLMWIKNPSNLTLPLNWNSALLFVNSLNSDGYCGHSDWRIPNRKELFSLIDYSKGAPALPDGSMLSLVLDYYYYWSSTSYASNSLYAWCVDMLDGMGVPCSKSFPNHILPVRGGVSNGSSYIFPDEEDYNFGEVNISSSISNQFTIYNFGDINLIIGKITVSGTNTGSFSLINDNCSGQAVLPEETCTVEVQFKSTSAGEKVANLKIPSNDLEYPVYNLPNLTGTGTTRLTVSLSHPDGGRVTGGRGIDCPGVCSEAYSKTQDITLTVSPKDGHNFTSWTGCNSTFGASCTVTISTTVNRTVTANFSPTSMPSAPSNLTATPVSQTQINLSWTDNSTNESSFRIERKTSPTGSWSQIASVGANITSYSHTGLNANTTYYYRVRAYNSLGYSSYTPETSAATFPPVPNVPLNLTATPVSQTQINLTWTDNSTNETGFKIERKTGAFGTYSQIASLGANSTSYADNTGLIANTTYYYRIRAYNLGGDSLYSDEANATTLPLPPNAPTNLAAVTTSSSSIVLTWVDKSNNESGFKIERKTGNCTSTNAWAEIATTSANVKSFINNELNANTQYSFQIKAYNSGGASGYSNCVSATTAVAGTPASPSGLKATSVSSNQINLVWADNSDNETKFEVWRKKGSDPWSLLTTKKAGVKSHNDTTADSNTSATSYSYYIKACNASGCSQRTNVAIVPFAPTNLSANAISSTQIKLTWLDKSNNETGFQIQRKKGDCSSTNSWTLFATKTKNIVSHTDGGRESGTVYSYRIRSYTKSTAEPASFGYSAWSECASATTL